MINLHPKLKCPCLPKALIAICLFFLTISTTLYANDYYLDSQAGNDDSSGDTINQPWKTIARLNQHQLQPGDTVHLKRGSLWNEEFQLSWSGKERQPITITNYGKGNKPSLLALLITGNNLIIKGLIVDHNKLESDAVKITGASNCVLENMTIRNGARDGIDVSKASNLHIRDSVIHHFLAGSFHEQMDAHGIVVTETQGVTIKNTEIHHVSGDSFQSDPARNPLNISNNILIEDSHFWTGPLTEDFNAGWLKTDHLPDKQKQYPGENAIDTKVVKTDWEKVARMRITIKNLTAHGWKNDGFITNKAALNLKEKVDITIDGITLYDNEIAFRIRGNRGNANVTIKNALVYQSEKGIRAEDDLHHLRLYNSTFGHGINRLLQLAEVQAGKDTWDLKNNLFPKRLSRFKEGSSNYIIKPKAYHKHFRSHKTGDYRLKPISGLNGKGIPLPNVRTDRQGRKRKFPYSVGAFQ